MLAWCLADENHPLAEQAMRHVIEEGAVAPGIWWYELRNALLMNERRGRLDAADVAATLADLAAMRIRLDVNHNAGRVLDLARQHRLSVYDAAYLELAVRARLPLASLDRRLRSAAAEQGIALLERGAAKPIPGLHMRKGLGRP